MAEINYDSNQFATGEPFASGETSSSKKIKLSDINVSGDIIVPAKTSDSVALTVYENPDLSSISSDITFTDINVWLEGDTGQLPTITSETVASVTTYYAIFYISIQGNFNYNSNDYYAYSPTPVPVKITLDTTGLSNVDFGTNPTFKPIILGKTAKVDATDKLAKCSVSFQAINIPVNGLTDIYVALVTS